MNRTKTITLGLACVAVFAAVLVFVGVSGKEGVSVGVPQAVALCKGNSPACLPDFEVEDTDGNIWNREKLAGKIVLVNVFATWCAPCKIEIPDFARIYNEYSDKGVEILGLMHDSNSVSEEKLVAFRRKTGMNFPALPVSEELLEKFDDPSNLPISFLYDQSGHLVVKRLGILRESELKSEIDKMLTAEEQKK